MNDKLKIRLSEAAYYELLTMVKREESGLCIRFNYKDGCCGSNKLDISIDYTKKDDIIDKIDELNIVYDNEVAVNFKDITLVYRNNSFMAKSTMRKAKDCATCTVGCGKSGNYSEDCSKCNKLA